MTKLGPIRRHWRDYSYHQRPFGKSAGDRRREAVLQDQFHQISVLYLLKKRELRRLESSIAFNPTDPRVIETNRRARRYLLMTACLVSELEAINDGTNIPPPDEIPHIRLTLDDFTDQEAEEQLGMSKGMISELHEAMQFPPRLSIGSEKPFYVDGWHAFLYFLYRMYSPSKRMALDQDKFGYDYSSLSKIFKSVVEWIDNNHKHRLRRINEDLVQKFPQFNASIVATLRHKNNLQHDDPLPSDAECCALFADNCRFHIARPDGPYWVQKAVFCKHKFFHSQSAQGVMGPDGIFYDWFDGPLGRRSDKYFLSLSDINARLAALQEDNPIEYWVYTDKGYNQDSHIRCAAHGPGYVSPQQHECNRIMSRERIGIEWGFGKVLRRCGLLCCQAFLKIREKDVAQLIRVAVLLTNAHSCSSRESQVSLYFNCAPPTLQEYFA
jgi:hypothetical protein